MNFTLNEETLDPRPDSEVIIESILKHFKDKLGNLRILDLKYQYKVTIGRLGNHRRYVTLPSES